VAKYLFVGWEGCIVDAGDGWLSDPARLRLLEAVIPALVRFSDAGYTVVAATNRPEITAERARDAAAVDALVVELLRSQGVSIDAVRVCPHAPHADCDCRKPGLGLVAELLEPMDRRASLVVDVADSAERFARSLGVAHFELRPGDVEADWKAAVHTLLDGPRQAQVRRKTRETDIVVTVDLDAAADPVCRTGLAFFDHMLEQLGKHGGFRLEVLCDGDLHIDEHHTIEDVALATGSAIREALGDKRGIERYGFVLPMDETRAEVSLDLGGRPYLVFNGQFPREEVGGMPTELVEHFFRSFSDALGATLNVHVSGANTHHMIEACFKGLARALRTATRRTGDVLPSTKGVL